MPGHPQEATGGFGLCLAHAGTHLQADETRQALTERVELLFGVLLCRYMVDTQQVSEPSFRRKNRSSQSRHVLINICRERKLYLRCATKK
ncbi:hypothetical protein HKBW3S09_01475 [Candidatus Hakubella thermalkaliphila]|uniref:Uncharacterized protein n=1 Tax=Candidatus Hakubella thermalkaliphila TaxID=2754717 RepID=A0A6V8NUQ9_9ACTN|nr:hypothetical protein [Actinomycetota bacterium]GFP24009.1 hypothetical protein HKBW3S09_01475 [Candidatus Hakubella thermalkaliphila]